jgi:hypothetical protein
VCGCMWSCCCCRYDFRRCSCRGVTVSMWATPVFSTNMISSLLGIALLPPRHHAPPCFTGTLGTELALHCTQASLKATLRGAVGRLQWALVPSLRSSLPQVQGQRRQGQSGGGGGEGAGNEGQCCCGECIVWFGSATQRLSLPGAAFMIVRAAASRAHAEWVPLALKYLFGMAAAALQAVVVVGGDVVVVAVVLPGAPWTCRPCGLPHPPLK